MLWQDFVFMIGSGLSIVFLAPTLRDASARVPLGTSLPSMAIGLVYATTFFTLGMTLSAAGSFAAGTMWALIALIRSPATPTIVRNTDPALVAQDARRWLHRLGSNPVPVEQYADIDGHHDRH
ncbi:hypothetical protein [Natrarchaeobaculum sulfurireducens]|uniref:Uncharacterized protein n=1 Tax=Natrarchaeobaculum sulfurireducens TaxID=2044521 RepID=A0A346PLG6_9EURY|nr:hypothetical protein [Natrarchaeobaculum sulfurireducens]AXR76690.1 hypothetical protein AArc1_0346 [Natrarchaeobaculum sulfurireducens]AXR80361.1 hypothetical protein AArcMg_0338 [Natrarchaeobaculum sulfurireducens]